MDVCFIFRGNISTSSLDTEGKKFQLASTLKGRKLGRFSSSIGRACTTYTETQCPQGLGLNFTLWPFAAYHPHPPPPRRSLFPVTLHLSNQIKPWKCHKHNTIEREWIAKTCQYTNQFSECWDISQDKWKLGPPGDARRKVRRSTKRLQLIHSTVQNVKLSIQ